MPRIVSNETPKHPIAKLFLAMGYEEFEIVYSPRFSPDWGWTILYCHPEYHNWPYSSFLGYNQNQALKALEKCQQELLKKGT